MDKTDLDRRLDEALDKLLDDRYAYGKIVGKAVGEQEGRAEGQIETILTVLRARFKKIPKRIANSIRQMINPITLNSCAAHVATCLSLDEFAGVLHSKSDSSPGGKRKPPKKRKT